MSYVVEVYTYIHHITLSMVRDRDRQGSHCHVRSGHTTSIPQSNDLAPENPGGCTMNFCHPTPTLGDATHTEHGVYAIHSTLSLLLARIHYPPFRIRIEGLAGYHLYHHLKGTPMLEGRRRHHQPPTCHRDEPRRTNHHGPPLPPTSRASPQDQCPLIIPIVLPSRRSTSPASSIHSRSLPVPPSSSAKPPVPPLSIIPSRPTSPDPGPSPSTLPHPLPLLSRSCTHLRSMSRNATTTHPSNFPPTYSSN